MRSNVGHTIQKMINNTPTSVSVNATTSTVVTNGGSVFQTGLIGNKIQATFEEVMGNINILDHIVQVASTNERDYLLSKEGSVFEYNYTTGACSPVIREVYTPAVCCGDKAVKIVAGQKHIVILTEKHKVWGVGCNSEYQLVPQGQCRYDTAVELIVTDTNVHDNSCCYTFSGCYNELCGPEIPDKCKPKCQRPICISGTIQSDECVECKTVCHEEDCHEKHKKPCPKIGNCFEEKECCDKPQCKQLGTVTLTQISTPNNTVLVLPVYGNLTYQGTACVDDCGRFNGTVTTTVTSLFIPSGCIKVTYTNSQGITSNVTVSISSAIQLLSSTPYTQVNAINGECHCPSVTITLNPSLIPLAFTVANSIITINTSSVIAGVCGTVLAFADAADPITIPANSFTYETHVKCCPPKKCKEVELPQPCWQDISAGGNISALIDECNRVFVFGSIHEIRNNRELLRKSCLDELLECTDAKVCLPADQLNCLVKPNNTNCTCNKLNCQCDARFKTDLSKFGITLNFAKNDRDCDGCAPGVEKRTTVCDFLKALKKCNEEPVCDNTCAPCDSYVHLCVDGCDRSKKVGTIILHNKKSVCKTVSQRKPDCVLVCVNECSTVEYDTVRYCIDASDYPLDKTIVLKFNNDSCESVDMYVDLDNPGGIMFNCNKKHNVEFNISPNVCDTKFILNYGSVLDPVELTNLKYALGANAAYPCPRFKNPIHDKIINTYLRGGDYVKFVDSCKCNRLAITADVPTVFRFNRRVLDIAIGNNNMSVLVGGLACPNEIYVIGNNCYGQLGIGSYETFTCWKQVNRCLFDCQVNAIFAGSTVTMYITQSGRVYGAGKWKCLVNSPVPTCVSSIRAEWKIVQIAISQNQILLLSHDGCVFGVGDNSLGELGLCHTNCVKTPVSITFFYSLNQSISRQFMSNLSHPVLDVCKKSCKKSCDCEEKCCEKKVKYVEERPYYLEQRYGKRWNCKGNKCSGKCSGTCGSRCGKKKCQSKNSHEKSDCQNYIANYRVYPQTNYWIY